MPEIDDFFIASAHNNETWMDVLTANKNQIIVVVYSTPILAAAIFTTFVAVFVDTAWCSCKGLLKEAREDDNPLISKRVRSAISAAIAIISAVHIAYALLVSCYACVAIKDQPDLILENSPLANVSIMVMAADGVLPLLCIATDVLAFFDRAVRVRNSFDLHMLFSAVPLCMLLSAFFYTVLMSFLLTSILSSNYQWTQPLVWSSH